MLGSAVRMRNRHQYPADVRMRFTVTCFGLCGFRNRKLSRDWEGRLYPNYALRLKDFRIHEVLLKYHPNSTHTTNFQTYDLKPEFRTSDSSSRKLEATHRLLFLLPAPSPQIPRYKSYLVGIRRDAVSSICERLQCFHCLSLCFPIYVSASVILSQCQCGS